MVLEKVRKLFSLVRNGEFDKMFEIIAWNLPKRLFFYGHNVLLFSRNPGWKARIPAGYSVRFATPDDVEMLQKSGSRKEAILERLKAGDKSLVILKDGKVISMIWGATGKLFIWLSGATFDTGDNGCFYYGTYTDQAARGLGISASAHQLIHEVYAAEGRCWSWALVSANNSDWLSTILKKNYINVGETFFLRFLFVNICYYKKWPFPVGRLKLFLKNPPRQYRPV
jgi:hypothetical protein